MLWNLNVQFEQTLSFFRQIFRQLKLEYLTSHKQYNVTNKLDQSQCNRPFFILYAWAMTKKE